MSWQQIVLAFTVLLLVTLSSGLPNECTSENIPQLDPDLCCNLQGIIDRNVAEECKTRFGDSLRHPLKQEHSAPTGCCFSECVLNVTGILRNGAIDSPFTINYWKQHIPDPRMADVIDGGVAQCLQEVTNRKADFDLIANLPPTPTGQRICNPLSGHFLGCIHSFIFRNCPDTRWVGKKECQSLKEHFQNCPLPFPINSK